jgi:hypothetical protein
MPASGATQKPAAQQRTGDLVQPGISRRRVLILCVQRQAAAVGILRFFRLGVFAFEIAKRHIE